MLRAMKEKEQPAVIDAADELNDVVEDLAFKTAGVISDGDPEHVVGTTNEQVYTPEANELPSLSACGKRQRYSIRRWLGRLCSPQRQSC